VLWIPIDTSTFPVRVVRILEYRKGSLEMLLTTHCDNGRQILSDVSVESCLEPEVRIRFIQPGEPNQNAFVERLNQTVRPDALDTCPADNLRQVGQIAARCPRNYTDRPPHEALGRIPPTVLREHDQTTDFSTCAVPT
jgi:putative transposase